MGDIIKFRTARKKIERELDQQRAAENRVRYGRSKTERALEAARKAHARQELDQHRVETGDER
jgi:hypothetical protein